MRIFQLVLLVMIIAISVAAGAAKIMQMEQEIDFFKQAGLDAFVVRPFGLFQLAGALLAIFPKTRISGTVIIGLAFLLSAILIFIAGNLVFGLISLVPVAISFWAMQHHISQSKPAHD